MMKLYEFGPTRSARVRWTLQELGVAFESVVVDLRKGEHRTPEYLRLNPYGRVPVLVDGDLVLSESAAICVYLADKYSEKGLIPPAGTKERGLHDKWLFFSAGELDQAAWRVHCHLLLYPEEKRVPAVAELGREDFRIAATLFEDAIGSRATLLHDRFSVADIVLAHTLYWATWYEMLDGFPNLQAYLKVQQKRSAYPDVLQGG